MIVSNKKMKDVEEFMQKLDNDMRERKVTDFRIARLKKDIMMMSRDRESVQRSRNILRIGRFNQYFVAKLGELSKLLQTTGHSDRDEVARIVRKIKAQ